MVEERLAEGWSPEQVSGRLRKEGHPVAGRQWTCRHVHADRRAGGQASAKVQKRKFPGRQIAYFLCDREYAVDKILPILRIYTRNHEYAL